MAELKALPPAKLEVAAGYIHSLHEPSREDRVAILRETSGILPAADADAIEKAIAEGCENIDESGW